MEDFALLRAVRAVLATTPARWEQLVAAIDGDRLQESPQAGEWSALDCLGHLVMAEREAFQPRLQAILAGVAFPVFDQDASGALATAATPWELAAEFARIRQIGLAALDQITAADLARTGTHPELGAVTLGELLHEWAAHDLMHTVQAERALMQPFIAGTGPWRSYFTGHDVQPAS